MDVLKAKRTQLAFNACGSVTDVRVEAGDRDNITQEGNNRVAMGCDAIATSVSNWQHLLRTAYRKR
jgi:hypothetical protein